MLNSNTANTLYTIKDELDREMMLLLIDACYFWGRCIVPFERSDSTQGTFYMDTNTDKFQVVMMHKTERLNYCVWREFGAHAVAIPYSVRTPQIHN